MIALFAGVGSVFALAPISWWLVPFITFSIMVWLVDGAAKHAGIKRFWSGAEIGWWFGFGYFLAGLYWIGSAFLVEADRFAWLLPFAMTILPMGLALFFAIAFGAAHMFWRPGVSRTVVLAICLASAEWLRGHVLSGFPWNNLGYLLTGNEILMQSASVLGIYGLCLFGVIFLRCRQRFLVSDLQRPVTLC